VNVANRASRILAIFAFAFLITAALLSSTRFAYARSPGATPGRAGVPGTSSCTVCHTEPPGAKPQGTIAFSIANLQQGKYVPGQMYAVTVTLTAANPPLPGKPRLRWGFEATAVFSTNNMRAGTLSVPAGSTTVQKIANDRVGREYVTHTQAGTFKGMGSPRSWTFDWRAPAVADAADVKFYACGIAGDNNSCPPTLNEKTGAEGDYTYCGCQTIQPVKPAQP